MDQNPRTFHGDSADLVMKMILTGEPLSAHEAHAHGLVNRVAPVERYPEFKEK